MRPTPSSAAAAQMYRTWGKKEVYLPNFAIALKRPHPLASPYTATFIVPLWFSKLDLKDYLFHAYSVPCHNIRSYVEQTRVRQGAVQNSPKPTPKRWHRPKATKRMTVELARPFVWPAEPAELKDWNREEIEMAEEENEELQKRVGRLADAEPVGEERRSRMREQAKALLEGRERWRSGQVVKMGEDMRPAPRRTPRVEGRAGAS